MFQSLVILLALTFAIAQFSTLLNKQYYCTNVTSFDPEVEEIRELLDTSSCLAPPGLYIPGQSVADILTDEDLAIVYVGWSKFDLNTMFDFSGMVASEEIRFILGAAVAILAFWRLHKVLKSKGKTLKPWYKESCWKRPKALWSQLKVKHLVWTMAFATVNEITLQFIKFLYIGGIPMPIIGQINEVASSNVMSYMAFVIGINVGTEGCCWCAYIWNTEIGCIGKPTFVSLFVVVDIFMDLLYFSVCFLDVWNELGSDTHWYDYLVCLSEGNIFLYFTLLFPIYKVSSAVKTLDNFWYWDTHHQTQRLSQVQKLYSDSSETKKLNIRKMIGGFFLGISSIAGAAYLIIWTTSHIEKATVMCDSAMECYDNLVDDPMMAWSLGGCYKGKVYPFVPMENYISPDGEKLYCDCKYAIVNEVSTIESAVGFVERMRSLRWLFLKVRIYEPVTKSFDTPSNLQVIQMELHYE